MRILDRHIASRTVVNTAVVLTILAVFIVVVDVFLSLEGYLRAARRVAGEDAGGLRLTVFAALAVVDLWGPRLLQLAPQLMGAALVAGVGFTCAQFSRNREFVAVLASGVSLHRLAAPIAATALGAVFLVALAQEFLLPPMAPLLARGHTEALRRSVGAFAAPMLVDGQNRLFYAASFDPQTQVMRDVRIWERDRTGVVRTRIAAKEARWEGDRWRLVEGLAEPAADPGREEPVDTVRTDLTPTVVTALRVRGYAEGLSVRQVRRALRAARSEDSHVRRRLETILWGRLAVLAGVFLSTIVALPFFLQRMPMNMAAQSIKAAPVSMAVLVGSSIGAAQPAPGLPVWLGVSIAPLIATPVALWALASIRT
ncbi:MAG: LptF/LptG family permease [Planctomycetota bacterium]|nr:MAG: LptF/LptG family permease [Planctomycetota bacterium]